MPEEGASRRSLRLTKLMHNQPAHAEDRPPERGGWHAADLIGMVAAVMGYLPPLEGAVAQEFIDLAAALNALRVAIPPAAKADF